MMGTQKGLLGEITDGSWIKSEILLCDTQDGEADVLPILYLLYFLP